MDIRTTSLPAPIAAYLMAANAQDADAVASCFADDAVVRDEGRTRHGSTAIREWAAEVSRRYRPMTEAIGAAEHDGGTILTARVSGNFPGSPIDLRYDFTLNGEKISRLEIS